MERKENAMHRRAIQIAIFSAMTSLFALTAFAGIKIDSSSQAHSKSKDVANEADRQILAELKNAGVSAAERCNDEDFLRRVSLDIVGQLPSPEEVIAFRADLDPEKRTKLIEKRVGSPEFGLNWARYWRDVIYLRSTEQRSRLNQEEFETWMADQWNRGVGWNVTTTSLLTATGNVKEHPETALIFAQGADADEVAAEACRIFLGIQLQCANCHDHPSDVWKREQFHQLAAYFPRITERRTPGNNRDFEIASVNSDRRNGDFMRENPERFIARFDRNRDRMVSKEELTAGSVMMGRMKAQMKPEMKGAQPDNKLPPQLIDRLFGGGDTNQDGQLTAEEIKSMPAQNNMRRGSTEHHMVDLQNPGSEGKLIDPKFFVDGSSIPHGQPDEERRQAVSKAFTSPTNPWFARAIVNRIWTEMLGEGFYMPIDDLGPRRTARYPEVLDYLCQNFVANGHDPKWLVRTIANTEAYQRKIQPKLASENDLPFAAATPVPLRSDIIFSSLIQVFGIPEAEMGRRGNKGMGNPDNTQAFRRKPRFGFDLLFGVDPSVPKDEVTGTIPQSLMMMNSQRFRAGMAVRPGSRLGKILQENPENKDALKELYLLVLSREPSANEIEICSNYIAEVKTRPEAFEDVMWSLINSSEFISRR